jgi:hypothetical protein
MAELGFPALTDVRGRLSIADLFPARKSRTGVYLLAFDDLTFYIGQAREVCRRFVQHRNALGRISGFSFLPVAGARLDQTERELIHAAESASLPITNRVHVTDILGEADLDQLATPADQERWIGTWPRPTQDSDEQVQLPENSPARIRTKHAWERLCDRPHWDLVRGCLQKYVISCIPFPKRTQLSFWSVSCLPVTNRSTWPRFAAVNAGVMETLVLGWNLSGDGTWGFVNVSRERLEREYGSLAKLRRTWRNIEFNETRRYRSAGADQVTLHAPSIEDLSALLAIAAVCDAAGTLMLRVMRTRPTIYSKYHCPALADAILTEDAT